MMTVGVRVSPAQEGRQLGNRQHQENGRDHKTGSPVKDVEALKKDGYQAVFGCRFTKQHETQCSGQKMPGRRPGFALPQMLTRQESSRWQECRGRRRRQCRHGRRHVSQEAGRQQGIVICLERSYEEMPAERPNSLR
jgi:hypothetical protein